MTNGIRMSLLRLAASSISSLVTAPGRIRPPVDCGSMPHGATGGQVLNVEKIENFPGFPDGIAGFDLGPIVMEQAEKAGATFAMDTATGLAINGDERVVHCAGQDIPARSVIVAAGSSLRA